MAFTLETQVSSPELARTEEDMARLANIQFLFRKLRVQLDADGDAEDVSSDAVL